MRRKRCVRRRLEQVRHREEARHLLHRARSAVEDHDVAPRVAVGGQCGRERPADFARVPRGGLWLVAYKEDVEHQSTQLVADCGVVVRDGAHERTTDRSVAGQGRLDVRYLRRIRVLLEGQHAQRVRGREEDGVGQETRLADTDDRRRVVVANDDDAAAGYPLPQAVDADARRAGAVAGAAVVRVARLVDAHSVAILERRRAERETREGAAVGSGVGHRRADVRRRARGLARPAALGGVVRWDARVDARPIGRLSVCGSRVAPPGIRPCGIGRLAVAAWTVGCGVHLAVPPDTVTQRPVGRARVVKSRVMTGREVRVSVAAAGAREVRPRGAHVAARAAVGGVVREVDANAIAVRVTGLATPSYDSVIRATHRVARRGHEQPQRTEDDARDTPGMASPS